MEYYDSLPTAGQPREGEIADHDNGPNIKRSQKEKGRTAYQVI